MSYATKDLRNAFKARLAGGSIGPAIAWPNVEYSGGRPLLEVSTTEVSREDDTLNGGKLREIGIFSVVVVTGQGAGENDALDYADAVASLFTMGQRITFTGGEAVITQPADIRGGFPDEQDWRVPVVCRYEAKAS